MKKEIPWNLIIQKLKHDITAEGEKRFAQTFPAVG